MTLKMKKDSLELYMCFMSWLFVKNYNKYLSMVSLNKFEVKDQGKSKIFKASCLYASLL